MNSIITWLLGGTSGAASSEARVTLSGLVSAAALYYTGQPVQAVHLAMVSIGAYATSRGMAKLGSAISEAVTAREVAAIVANREPVRAPVVPVSAAAEAARLQAFADADAALVRAQAERKAAYDAANTAFEAARK